MEEEAEDGKNIFSWISYYCYNFNFNFNFYLYFYFHFLLALLLFIITYFHTQIFRTSAQSLPSNLLCRYRQTLRHFHMSIELLSVFKTRDFMRDLNSTCSSIISFLIAWLSESSWRISFSHKCRFLKVKAVSSELF